MRLSVNQSECKQPYFFALRFYYTAFSKRNGNYLLLIATIFKIHIQIRLWFYAIRVKYFLCTFLLHILINK